MVNVKEIEKLQIDQEKSNKDLAGALQISVQALLKKKKGIIRWSLDDVKAMREYFGINDSDRVVQIFLGASSQNETISC